MMYLNTDERTRTENSYIIESMEITTVRKCTEIRYFLLFHGENRGSIPLGRANLSMTAKSAVQPGAIPSSA